MPSVRRTSAGTVVWCLTVSRVTEGTVRSCYAYYVIPIWTFSKVLQDQGADAPNSEPRGIVARGCCRRARWLTPGRRLFILTRKQAIRPRRGGRAEGTGMRMPARVRLVIVGLSLLAPGLP